MPGFEGKPLPPRLVTAATETVALVANLADGEVSPRQVATALNDLQVQLRPPADVWYRYTIGPDDRLLSSQEGHTPETVARLGGLVVVSRDIEVPALEDTDRQLLRLYPWTYLWMTGRLVQQREPRTAVGLNADSFTSGRLRTLRRAAALQLHGLGLLRYPPDFQSRART
jgi:hypothetical protein